MNAYEVKEGMMYFAGETVPERQRLECEVLQ